jgi:hypothetical protein
MEHIEEVNDLFYGIRRSGLLTISKSGVGNEDLFGGRDKDEFIIKFHPAYFIVWEKVPIKVRLLNI